ncbi:chromate transporter [Brevibacillus fluminis]|uniref:chromate transporter n=1 Tax=Brevibacillus fluminis TaxID=511487 RepID=UPI003F8A91DD
MPHGAAKGYKTDWQAIWNVLLISTKLGLTSFGGPIAHLGYFHNEYVRRQKWIDERSYADLVALCQFLPGPASSQVGIGIGVMRAGMLGGIAAWIGFTWPSVIALVLFAFGIGGLDLAHAGWIHGLKLVAVAIVAQAMISMGQKLAPDRSRATIALGTAAIALLWPSSVGQVILIAAAGLIGTLLYRKAESGGSPQIRIPITRMAATICLVLFFALLLGLPLLRNLYPLPGITLFDSFYRAGSLVFGGGHVVLPLLEKEVVPTGWISKGAFLAGYGAAQAVPGPLFTFAAYLGAVRGGWLGAAVATLAIFLPAFLLVVGVLPFWAAIRKSPKIQGALAGVNAAVVGLLLCAFYDPIWTSTIVAPADFAAAVVLFLMLVFWKMPPWVVVAAGMVAGWVLAG